jgi:hypothetical protein
MLKKGDTKMANDVKKTLVFDMDGTIADLYGVNGWLTDLESENTRPYEIAEPIYDTFKLNNILEVLKGQGWQIVVTTWLAKGSTREYDNRVRKAKLDWLKAHKFPYDEIHLVKYGTTKANCTRAKGGYQVLVDDNEQVRKGWTLGQTINAKYDILPQLTALMRD